MNKLFVVVLFVLSVAVVTRGNSHSNIDIPEDPIDPIDPSSSSELHSVPAEFSSSSELNPHSVPAEFSSSSIESSSSSSSESQSSSSLVEPSSSSILNPVESRSSSHSSSTCWVTDFLGKCGKTDKDNVLAYYDASADLLTIKGTGEMMDYEEYNDPKYDQRPWKCVLDRMDTVIIEKGVKSVGDFAFHKCSGLVKIEISSTVKTIGEAAFKLCSSLIKLGFDEGSTLELIKTAAFKKTNIYNLRLPNSLVEIGVDAFRRCQSLTCVNLSNSIRRIENGAFAFCPELHTFIFSGTDGPNCNRNAFGDSGLNKVNVPLNYPSDKLCGYSVNKVDINELVCLSNAEEVNEKLKVTEKKTESLFTLTKKEASKVISLFGVPGCFGLAGATIIFVYKIVEYCIMCKNDKRQIAYEMWELERRNSFERWKATQSKEDELEKARKLKEKESNKAEKK